MTPSLLPDSIRLGPVRLRVADRRRSGEWLARVLGLSLLGETGGHEVWGGRDGTPLVELREHPGARPIPQGGRPGIYHYAILLPNRAELGGFLAHLDAHGIEHADSDHLVSEAIYLVDPDGITVEVYADRPRERWARQGDDLVLTSLPLDHPGLLAAGAAARWLGLPAGTRMGHLHLHVGDLGEAERFYVDGLGFAITTRAFRGALFISAAGYHHHVGLNIWAALRAPAGPDDAGLDEWTLVVPDGPARDALALRLEGLGIASTNTTDAIVASDPWGIPVRVTGA
ncbi:MAG TPA: VOC family protein [Methylomirabilota bacterium]|jgi:catechol 2,3-dioxygenase|nr:VOC family protein [Methylomirabilota bacterium]